MSSNWKRRGLAGLVLVLALAGAARWLSLRNGDGGASPTATAASTAMAPAALQLASSDVDTVRRVTLVRQVEATGSLKARQSAILKAKVAGELRELQVREGETVKAGQALGLIDPTELDWRLRQAEQQAQAARAQWDAAQRTLANNQALVSQGFISATALDASQYAANGARASWEAAQSAVELARKARADAVLSAPIAGQVSQRLAQPGERLPVDGRILEIVDLSQLELEVAVAASDVPQVRVGATAEIEVDGLGTVLAGRVLRLNPSTVAGSRSVMVYLGVPAHPALRQGLFARARIDSERLDTLAVHARSVRQDQPEPGLLAVQRGVVQRVQVKTGPSGVVAGLPMTAILEGAPEGLQVLAGTVGTVANGIRVHLPDTTPMSASAPASAHAAR